MIKLSLSRNKEKRAERLASFLAVTWDVLVQTYNYIFRPDYALLRGYRPTAPDCVACSETYCDIRCRIIIIMSDKLEIVNNAETFLRRNFCVEGYTTVSFDYTVFKQRIREYYNKYIANFDA